MKSKEALEKLDHTLCLNSPSLKFNIDNEEHIDCKDVNEMVDCVETIEKDLEILEEIRDYFKVIDYGEEFQDRYAIQVMYPYPAGFIYSIRKDVYDKWNRWLNNDK